MTADGLPTWQTDGIVWDVEYVNGVVFVGGTFGNVRPPGADAGTQQTARKNFAAFDAATGDLLPCTADFTKSTGTATVRALSASPDGTRLYVGGAFSGVSGAGVANIVALKTSDCSLVPNTQFRRPSVSATVRAVSATSTNVYLGGDFTKVDSQSRARYAQVSSAGVLAASAPSFDAPVRAVLAAPDFGKVIVGGDFANVNGTANRGLISVDPLSGVVVQTYPDWIPTNSVTKVIVRDQTNFYVGAEGTGGGVFDGRIAADLATGNQLWKDLCLGATQALAPYNGVLYSGHHAHDCSQTQGGFPDGKRHHLLAQSISDKAILPWFPNTNGGLGEALGPRAMAIADDELWVVGEFTKVNDKPQQGITRFALEPDTGYVNPPTLKASSAAAGKVRISWTAGWDLDDDMVTYELFRVGTPDPISVQTVSSREWNRPPMSFFDDVTPGQTVSYRIRTSDGTNVSPKGTPVEVTAATTTTPYRSDVWVDGPTMNWRLDETSGITAADASGSGRTGTYQGTYTQGGDSALASGAGKSVTLGAVALGFIDSDGSVVPTNATAAAGPTSYSLEAWFKTTSSRGGKLLGFGNNRTGVSSQYDRHIYMNNSGNLIFGTWTGTANTIKSPSTYRNGQWHLVVATQGPAGMRLYVDGLLVGSNSVTGAEPYNGYWKVGGDNLDGWPESPTRRYFNGQIDEVAVYSAPLSALRVFKHYKGARPTAYPDSTPPSVPTGVNALASGQQVTVSWQPSTDNMLMGDYNVYRGTTAGFTPSASTLVGTTEATSSQEKVAPGTWYYKVVARDGTGNSSAPSSASPGVTSVDVMAPSGVTGLSATAFGSQVDLRWNAATDNIAVTSYDVHRLGAADEPLADANSVASVTTGTSYTDSDVAPGTWFYRVVARDAGGNSGSASTAEQATTVDDGSDIDFDGADALAPTPAFSTTMGATSTIPGATLVGPSDSRFTYRGAGGFKFGSVFPDTLMYQPTSRFPNSWGNPSVYSVDFVTDASAFEVYTKYLNTNQAIEVKVDGHRTTVVPRLVGGSTLGSRMTYKVDFGSSATRRIALEQSFTPFGGIYLPAGATLSQSPGGATRWMVVGDSITGGSAQNTGLGAGSWMLKAADYLGWQDAWNQSIGGTGYVATNGSSPAIPDRIQKDVIEPGADRVVLFAGYNDQTLPQDQIRQGAVSTLNTLATSAPKTRVYVVGPWSPLANPDNPLKNTDETLRQAAADKHVPFVSPATGRVFDATGTMIVNQRPWINDANASTLIGGDGIHPNDAGHAYIAKRMALALEQIMNHEQPLDLEAPAKVTDVAATANGLGVDLSWSASTDNVAVKDYWVYRGQAAGFVPSADNRVATSTTTSATEQSVPKGSWYYKVQARDAMLNESDASDAVQVDIVVPDVTPPTVPTGLTTAVTGSQVDVSWQASTDDTGVTEYVLHRSPVSSFTPDDSTKVKTVHGTSAADTGVHSGTWYYRVIAKDAAGHSSDASAVAAAVVEPPGPTTVTLTADDDTYVNFGNKTANFGAATSMIIDSSPEQIGYLRFTLPEAPAEQQLTSAKLVVRTTGSDFGGSVDSQEVHFAADSWVESTMTYNDMPALDAGVLGLLGPTSLLNNDNEILLDAQALSGKSGSTTLALKGLGPDNVQFFTSEAGAGKQPKLVLTYS